MSTLYIKFNYISIDPAPWRRCAVRARIPLRQFLGPESVRNGAVPNTFLVERESVSSPESWGKYAVVVLCDQRALTGLDTVAVTKSPASDRLL